VGLSLKSEAEGDEEGQGNRKVSQFVSHLNSSWSGAAGPPLPPLKTRSL
jgi:hypothetical protein